MVEAFVKTWDRLSCCLPWLQSKRVRRVGKTLPVCLPFCCEGSKPARHFHWIFQMLSAQVIINAEWVVELRPEVMPWFSVAKGACNWLAVLHWRPCGRQPVLGLRMCLMPGVGTFLLCHSCSFRLPGFCWRLRACHLPNCCVRTRGKSQRGLATKRQHLPRLEDETLQDQAQSFNLVRDD